MTPPNTFEVTCPAPDGEPQELDVPDVFREHLIPLLVGMEWAAIFDQRGDPAAAAGELRVAATAAEELAELLRTLRDRADRMAESKRADFLTT